MSQMPIARMQGIVNMSTSAGVGISLEQAKMAFSYVAKKPEDKNWLNGLELSMHAAMAHRREVDYQGLAFPAAWYLEPLRDLQPRSYGAFFQHGEPELLLLESVSDDVQWGKRSTWGLFIYSNERLIQLQLGDGQDGYCLRMEFDEALSLPEDLAKSWLWRAIGWRNCTELPCSPMVYRQMIRTTTQGIDDVLESFRTPHRDKAHLLKKLRQRFPDIAPSGMNGRWNLRSFLDTRPMGIDGPEGDQLFTRTKMRDGVVYRIRNGDASNLHILDNPAEAIDCYHEHLLLKRPGEFDFSPWACPQY